jgi:hypothetical protein
VFAFKKLLKQKKMQQRNLDAGLASVFGQLAQIMSPNHDADLVQKFCKARASDDRMAIICEICEYRESITGISSFKHQAFTPASLKEFGRFIHESFSELRNRIDKQTSPPSEPSFQEYDVLNSSPLQFACLSRLLIILVTVISNHPAQDHEGMKKIRSTFAPAFFEHVFTPSLFETITSTLYEKESETDSKFWLFANFLSYVPGLERALLSSTGDSSQQNAQLLPKFRHAIKALTTPEFAQYALRLAFRNNAEPSLGDFRFHSAVEASMLVQPFGLVQYMDPKLVLHELFNRKLSPSSQLQSLRDKKLLPLICPLLNIAEIILKSKKRGSPIRDLFLDLENIDGGNDFQRYETLVITKLIPPLMELFELTSLRSLPELSTVSDDSVMKQIGTIASLVIHLSELSNSSEVRSKIAVEVKNMVLGVTKKLCSSGSLFFNKKAKSIFEKLSPLWHGAPTTVEHIIEILQIAAGMKVVKFNNDANGGPRPLQFTFIQAFSPRNEGDYVKSFPTPEQWLQIRNDFVAIVTNNNDERIFVALMPFFLLRDLRPLFTTFSASTKLDANSNNNLDSPVIIDEEAHRAFLKCFAFDSNGTIRQSLVTMIRLHVFTGVNTVAGTSPLRRQLLNLYCTKPIITYLSKMLQQDPTDTSMSYVLCSMIRDNPEGVNLIAPLFPVTRDWGQHAKIVEHLYVTLALNSPALQKDFSAKYAGANEKWFRSQLLPKSKNMLHYAILDSSHATNELNENFEKIFIGGRTCFISKFNSVVDNAFQQNLAFLLTHFRSAIVVVYSHACLDEKKWDGTGNEFLLLHNHNNRTSQGKLPMLGNDAEAVFKVLAARRIENSQKKCFMVFAELLPRCEWGAEVINQVYLQDPANPHPADKHMNDGLTVVEIEERSLLWRNSAKFGFEFLTPPRSVKVKYWGRR